MLKNAYRRCWFCRYKLQNSHVDFPNTQSTRTTKACRCFDERPTTMSRNKHICRWRRCSFVVVSNCSCSFDWPPKSQHWWPGVINRYLKSRTSVTTITRKYSTSDGSEARCYGFTTLISLSHSYWSIRHTFNLVKQTPCPFTSQTIYHTNSLFTRISAT